LSQPAGPGIKQPEPIRKAMPALKSIINANLVRNFVRNEKLVAAKHETPRAVIDFYPTREQAASLRHIHLDDCGMMGSKYLLVDKPNGSCSMLKLSGEVHMKMLLVRLRHKCHIR
jgi:hypothetical protein